MAEKIEGLSIGLDLDSIKVSTGMTDLKSKLRLTDSQLKANLSTFDRADKSIDKHQVTIDGLNKKLTVQQAITEKARKSYEKMVNEYGEGSIQAEKAARAYNTQLASLNNLERNIQRTTDELKEMRRQQSLNESSWTKLGQRIGETSNRLTGIGDKMQSVGRNMTLGMTAPVTALGIAAVRTGMTFDKEMSKVRAISGATGDQFNQMREQALKLGADTSKSASEVAAGQLEMAKAGYSVNEIMAAMPGIISASEAAGADMAQTAGVMSSALNIFGMEADKAGKVADILAQTANQSAADISDMEYALKYAGPPAAALGISLEELSASVGILSDSGMKGEQAGTTLRGALLALLNPSEENTKMMDKMGISVTDAQGNFVGLSKLVDNLSDSMAGQTDTQKAATLASLVGTEAVSGMLSLMKAGPDEIDKMTKSLKNSEGASAEAAKVMKDNFAGAMDELLGTMESIGIQISDEMVPVIKDLTVWLTDMGEKFQSLSPEMKRTVIITGLVAAGIGPLALGIGTLTKSIGFLGGGLVKGIGFLNKYRTQAALTSTTVTTMGNQAALAGAKMNTANAGMGKSTKGMKAMQGGAVAAGGAMSMFGGKWGAVAGVATMFLPEIIKGGKGLLDYGGKALGAGKNIGLLARGLGTARLGLTALGGPVGLGITGLTLLGEGGYKLYKHMKEETIPTMDNFGNKVSDSTSKAVLGYKKLNDDATAQLQALSWSGATISKEAAAQITDTFSKMGSQISASLKTDFDKSYSDLSIFLKNSKDISSTEQQNILNNIRAKHEEQQQTVQQYKDRVAEIYRTARQEKRNTTKAEEAEMAQINLNMMNMAVQTMSKSEVEQKAILERLRSGAASITARQAAETVANSVKAKDGAIKEAAKKRDQTIAAAIRERDEVGSISATEAATIIKEARRQHDEAVKKAKSMHTKVVEQARLQAGGQASSIDWATGEVLDRWDKMIRGVAGAVNSISSGINGFLKALHVDARIPMWNPKGMKQKEAKKPSFNQIHKGGGHHEEQYAKGTSASGHPGGPAIVGEEGRELGFIPGKGLAMLGVKGPEYHSNLPRGTSVLPNKHTENLLKSYGFPGYADGIGDYFKLAMKGPKGVVSHFWNKHWEMPKIGGIFTGISTGIGSLIKDSIQSNLKKKLDGLLDFGGSYKGGVAGPTQVQKWVTQALSITGTPLSWLPAMMQVAKHESGFNPRAINLWDINAKRGIPSKGLFQTIDPTFNAYKMRGMNDIYNPVHNAVAAIRYMKDRYGSVFNTPGMRALASPRIKSTEETKANANIAVRLLEKLSALNVAVSL